MKPKTIQQEILLIDGTSFSSKEYYLKDPDSKETISHSPLDNLEKACWAGMLCEMLPECINNNCKTYIWNILRGDHFLNINIGQSPSSIEKESSIDPYFFIDSLFFN